jgi:hypothetical protein
MQILSYVGTVENGQIRLSEAVRLPEHTEVYVIVPQPAEKLRFHIHSPRFAHPEQARDFVKVVTEVPENAEI